MTDRARLPDRRTSETFQFIHAHPAGRQEPVIASLGYYPDGRIGEVFFATDKNVGAELDVAHKDSCILLSFALQYGCPPAAIRAAMTRDAKGRPEGVMGTLLDLLSPPVTTA